MQANGDLGSQRLRRPDAPLAVTALFDRTIAMVAAHGLDGLSLRAIATGSGCSTAYIFQKFGNKDGLISAAIEDAIATDAAFHSAIVEEVTTLSFNGPVVADLIASYLGRRARSPTARFLSTMMIDGATNRADALAGWHANRVTFWQQILAGSHAPEFGTIIAAYVAMEEYYAFALHEQLRYDLLLRETCRALTAPIAAHAPVAAESATLVASVNALPLPAASPSRDGPGVREKLLDYAVDEIAGHGINAINQRKITRRAQVSGSAIAYYFGDMTAFVNEAIWRALINDIPRELDPAQRIDDRTMTMTAWLTSLSEFMRPGRDGQRPGFYTSYARITAQACLLAHARPALMPLVAYLRELDGWGTYRAGRHIAGDSAQVRRDRAAAFAIWIKGVAVLNDAKITADRIDVPRLLSVASALLDVERG